MDTHTETIASTVFIFYPAKAALHRAVIVHHGHGCEMVDRGEHPLHLEMLIRSLVSAGYSVAAVRMPCFQNPSNCGKTRVHDKLFDLELTSGSALRFFMEPIARTVNYLEQQKPALAEVDMIGLSGGGWTTTLYAAIDPRIRKSFPVAGTLPLYLRDRHYNHDLEQYFSPLYRIAGYKDLYVMGAAGKGRLQLQILNRDDDCCFGERQHHVSGISYAGAVRDYERDVSQTLAQMHTGRFVVHLDDSAHYHQISQKAIQDIILPVLGGGALPSE
jgi:dienelactone hydrolase